MQYGYFDTSAREYVITNPKTPVKWINYIGSLDFGGFIDHTGGALLCKNDPALNRITKYITQTPSSDFKGSTIYIRLKTEEGYRLFSPFFVPCLVALDRYECRVGLGYNRIVSQVWGIECDITIFVPPGSSCELRDIRITNLNSQPIEIEVIPVVEYTHFNSLLQLTNADWVPQTMQSEVIDQEKQQKILLQYAFMRKNSVINYYSSNCAVDSFDTDRRAFLGENEYGTWSNPSSLKNRHLTNSIALRGDNIAAILHSPVRLEPGETHELITQLGQAASLQEALPSIQKYRFRQAVSEAQNEMAEFWHTFLNRLQVNTPDPALNVMLNVHNPQQCYTTLNWSRYLSFYQLGYGARGIGCRDSSQDVMGVIALAPEQCKTMIRKLLSIQKRNGSALHQFNPLTMIGSEGDSLEREDRPHYYSDDHLWIILAIVAYLKETGEISFLEEQIPFYEKDKLDQPLEIASVFDHLCRAIEFTHADTGQHGLPLLGFADWNDTLNLPKGAESILAANLYGKALSELAEICDFLGQSSLVKHFQDYYQEMKERVNQTAWDGQWYLSYYDHDGQPLGSSQNDAGQIYAYGQAWPVISGFAPAGRAASSLDAVERMLNTRYGIKLSTPGFNGFDPTKGGVTTYPPGAKENGGIFLHVNPWVIIAETLSGNSERAYRYYSQINPAGKNDQIEMYECEPYVYPQNILGDEHPQFGLARNGWLSGTASWMYLAGTQYLLGIQPTLRGLRIHPCIPADWDGYQVTRVYRNATYQINISNPHRLSQEVLKIRINGKEITGDVIPIQPPGEYSIEVILGSAS